jgi:hypothetical protein
LLHYFWTRNQGWRTERVAPHAFAPRYDRNYQPGITDDDPTRRSSEYHHFFGRDVSGHLLHYFRDSNGWHPEDLTFVNGTQIGPGITNGTFLLDATQPKGRRCYWKSDYLSHIDPALCDEMITHAAKIPSPYSLILVFQIGGALNRLDEGHSPVGNRDARYLVTMAGAWEQPDEDGKNIEWARSAWNDMRPFSSGGSYINFQTEDEGYDRMEAALGKQIQRLATVKARWDPQNIFRMNRNIEPALQKREA